MIVVGQISTLEEVQQIELIRKIFTVGNRARSLALEAREAQTNQKKIRKNTNNNPNSSGKKQIPKEMLK